MRVLSLLLLVACGPKVSEPAFTPSNPMPVGPPRTYLLRTADAPAKPEMLGQAMREMYDVRLLIAVTGGPVGPVEVLLAPAHADGSQDLCAQTSRWTGLLASGEGRIATEGQTLNLSVDGDPSTLADVRLSARMGSGGLSGDQVGGLLDTRAYLHMMGNDLATDSICNMMPMLGPCVPCPDGSATCWAVELGPVTAAPVELAPQLRSAELISADPACSAVPSAAAP